MRWGREALVVGMLAGSVTACGGQTVGPPSADQTSESFDSLAEREAFLEQYVRFDRNYDELHFDIRYRNNGGGLIPGPSDWDVRVVAVVPPRELSLWTEGLDSCDPAETAWVDALPVQASAFDDAQWWCGPGTFVAVVPDASRIAYRAKTD